MAITRRNVVNQFFLNISLFRTVYMTALFFTSFCFIENIAIVMKFALMYWGMFLIFFYYVKAKRCFNVLYSRWILAFVFASVLTAVVHIVDNFFPNMVMVIHVMICFFIFYGMHTERNKKRIKREIYNISLIYIIAGNIIALAGIIALIVHGQILLPEYNYSLIIYENRFTGFYVNPNLLAFYSVVIIFCTHMISKKQFIKECGKKSLHISVIIISYVLNGFSLFLSDSNASLLLLGFYIIGNLIYRFFGSFQTLRAKQFLTRAIALLGCGVIILASLFSVRWLQNTAVSFLLDSQGQSVAMSQKSDKSNSGDDADSIDLIPNRPITFEHINKNIDSGRKKLVEQAAILVANYPFLGVGKENLTYYADKYIEGGLHFSDLHNGYLTIMVCNGIIGFVIFIGFAIHVARHCIKSLFLEKKSLKDSIFPCLFAFVFAYCIYAVGEKTLLLEQTFMVTVFWQILGYLSCYMTKYDHMQDRFNILSVFDSSVSQGLDNADAPTEDIQ